jgi:phage baseplate assembly protein W
MTQFKKVEYVIKVGDSLKSIATSVLYDSTKWLDIAYYNNLEYPYIVDVPPTSYATGFVTLFRDLSGGNLDTVGLTWTQDTSTSGHFSSSSPINNNDILANTYLMRVNGIPAKIVSIVGDGTTVGSVVVSNEMISGQVEYVYLDSQAFLIIPIGTVLLTSSGDKKYEISGSSNYTMYPDKDTLEVPISAINSGILGETPENTIVSFQSPILGISYTLNRESIKVIQNKNRATGTITVHRNAVIAETVIIPYGSTFVAPYDPATGTPIRTYYSIETITFLSTDTSVDIPIQCTEAGVVGNVYPNRISEISSLWMNDNDMSFIDPTQILSVYGNNDAISDGRSRNLKVAGDSILVPVVEIGTSTPKDVPTKDIYTVLFGEDVMLNNGDLYATPQGDLGLVTGLDNLKQSIYNRLNSILGASSLIHPDYGTILDSYVGTTITNETLELVKQEVARTVLADPRIKEVIAVGVAAKSGVLFIDMDIRILGVSDAQTIQFLIKGGAQ